MSHPTPIHTLTPSPNSPPPPTSRIRAVVTLAWPYSSSTRSSAFLLSDPDFRLRSQKGQVRVRFIESAAQKIRESRLRVGEVILLSLEGAKWLFDVSGDNGKIRLPGKSLEGELEFRSSLSLNIERDGGAVEVRVDKKAAPTSPSKRDRAEETAVVTPKRVGSWRASLEGGIGAPLVYASPAFLRRGRFTGEPKEIATNGFSDDLEAERSPRKKVRVSFGEVRDWRYVARTPSPVKEPPPEEPVPDPITQEDIETEEIEPESLDVPSSNSAVASTTQPLQAEPLQDAIGDSHTQPQEAVSSTSSMPPPPLPRLQVPSHSPTPATFTTAQVDEAQDPSTPRLQPVSSAVLPLPSPFPTATAQHDLPASTAESAVAEPSQPMNSTLQRLAVQDTYAEEEAPLSSPTARPAQADLIESEAISSGNETIVDEDGEDRYTASPRRGPIRTLFDNDFLDENAAARYDDDEDMSSDSDVVMHEDDVDEEIDPEELDGVEPSDDDFDAGSPDDMGLRRRSIDDETLPAESEPVSESEVDSEEEDEEEETFLADQKERSPEHHEYDALVRNEVSQPTPDPAPSVADTSAPDPASPVKHTPAPEPADPIVENIAPETERSVEQEQISASSDQLKEEDYQRHNSFTRNLEAVLAEQGAFSDSDERFHTSNQPFAAVSAFGLDGTVENAERPKTPTPPILTSFVSPWAINASSKSVERPKTPTPPVPTSFVSPWAVNASGKSVERPKTPTLPSAPASVTTPAGNNTASKPQATPQSERDRVLKRTFKNLFGFPGSQSPPKQAPLEPETPVPVEKQGLQGFESAVPNLPPPETNALNIADREEPTNEPAVSLVQASEDASLPKVDEQAGPDIMEGEESADEVAVPLSQTEETAPVLGMDEQIAPDIMNDDEPADDAPFSFPQADEIAPLPEEGEQAATDVMDVDQPADEATVPSPQTLKQVMPPENYAQPEQETEDLPHSPVAVQHSLDDTVISLLQEEDRHVVPLVHEKEAEMAAEDVPATTYRPSTTEVIELGSSSDVEEEDEDDTIKHEAQSPDEPEVAETVETVNEQPSEESVEEVSGDDDTVVGLDVFKDPSARQTPTAMDAEHSRLVQDTYFSEGRSIEPSEEPLADSDKENVGILADEVVSEFAEESEDTPGHALTEDSMVDSAEETPSPDEPEKPAPYFPSAVSQEPQKGLLQIDELDDVLPPPEPQEPIDTMEAAAIDDDHFMLDADNQDEEQATADIHLIVPSESANVSVSAASSFQRLSSTPPRQAPQRKSQYDDVEMLDLSQTDDAAFSWIANQSQQQEPLSQFYGDQSQRFAKTVIEDSVNSTLVADSASRPPTRDSKLMDGSSSPMAQGLEQYSQEHYSMMPSQEFRSSTNQRAYIKEVLGTMPAIPESRYEVNGLVQPVLAEPRPSTARSAVNEWSSSPISGFTSHKLTSHEQGGAREVNSRPEAIDDDVRPEQRLDSPSALISPTIHMEQSRYSDLPMSPSFSQSQAEASASQLPVPDSLRSAQPITQDLTQREAGSQHHEVEERMSQYQEHAPKTPEPQQRPRKSLKARVSYVPEVISAWFTPKRSGRAQLDQEAERELVNNSPTANSERERVSAQADGESIDPSEPRYCICGGVSWGTMIACDNEANCKKEWFHLECVGLDDLPPKRTKWYCPDCRKRKHEDLQAGSPSREQSQHGLQTSHAYFASLASLDRRLNPASQQAFGTNTVDVLAVITDQTTAPERAKGGPRDYFTIFRISDTSLANHASTRVEVFRPWKAVLPHAEVGDIVLLREFSIKSRKRTPYLLSTDASSWCVWRFGEQNQPASSKDGKRARGHRHSGGSDVREEVLGPPVEYGEDERTRAFALRHWWLETESKRKVTEGDKAAG